ncbi:hypothetical protein JCM19240_2456 [Vibrio maritimus]|uniref:Uncharacterized protein n=1 Tax=Vibrio maritimus TaxID=990268 RepID=A0A090T169_9VIBR|nr:hypothetical protein JCM19240_2456 [Vibrio maritimus]
MFTKKLTRLLDCEYIEQGNVAGFSALLLDSLVQSLYLHDASLWLTVSSDQIDCVSFHTSSKDETGVFSPINKQSFEQFEKQIINGSHLVYAYNNAEKASWMAISTLPILGRY